MDLSPLRFALAQVNAKVGDIEGNTKKIMDAYRHAAKQGAHMVICPELCLIGYPPEDLVLMPSFRQRAMARIEQLALETKGGPALIIGSVWDEGGQSYNAALLLEEGRIAFIQKKTLLPNVGIFDEKRLFAAERSPLVHSWRGIKLGLLICEDIWSPEPARMLASAGAELLIVINASPFEKNKLNGRKAVAGDVARSSHAPLIYVNLIGGQDDIVFDGGSFVLSASGETLAQLPEFKEGIELFSFGAAPKPHSVMSEEETLWNAMMLGLADYVNKNGFPGVLLGLSGGIDSALTAAVAVDALGPSRVHGVLLPSEFTSQESNDDAMALAKLLGIETTTIPITGGVQALGTSLQPVFGDAAWMHNLMLGGNLQARLRGTILMAISNKTGAMLLSTSNKSELAVGYSTLYGDSCGGYNVVKDLYKTQIYQLAHWRNAREAVIPGHSITRAPSAELAPGQTDQDQLPPYDQLDAMLTEHLEHRKSAEEIVALSYPADIVAKILRMVRNSEYKRRQSCPGVKLSPMLFGKDRRYPLTNGN